MLRIKEKYETKSNEEIEDVKQQKKGKGYKAKELEKERNNSQDDKNRLEKEEKNIKCDEKNIYIFKKKL